MILNNVLIIITFVAMVLISVTSKWQGKIAGLAIIYLVIFILLLQIWPVALASIKLIAGWMSMILIGASQITHSEQKDPKQKLSQTLFHLLINLLLWIVISVSAESFNAWIPIPYINLYIGLVILSAGVIYAGVHQMIFDVVIGILAILAGFDIIYSSVEGSALVTGILAVIMILIALMTTYFLHASDEMIQ